jgi:tetratricopeptide (TPR) repeat protein
MAIKGSLKEASLPDVLQLLTMGGKTGCLSVTDGQSFGYIYFQEGRIVYASLLNRRDRLGDVLVGKGLITREQLEEALEAQERDASPKRLGEILVAKGLIDRATLERCVRYHIQEAIFRLFTWNQGTFYFEPDKRPERETILVSIDPESLLLEVARRVDEWHQIQKKVPSFDLVFSLDSDRAASLSSVDLTPEQEKILPYLDGVRSGWDLVEETALSEFEVGKALYGLIQAGLVRKTGRRPREAGRALTEARVQEHWNLGVAFYSTSMFDEAVREFSRVLELAPDYVGAEFFLGLVELRRGELEKAEEKLRGVLERGGARPAVYHDLAVVLAKQGRLAGALELLDEGLARAKGHPKLLVARAMIELRRGDVAAAKRTLERYEAEAGEELSPLYYSTRALAEAMSRDMAAAVEVARRGLERHPRSAALANNLGVILERRGDAAGAREMYERAFEEEPDLPQASKNLGDLLYRDGRYEEAAEAYRRALRADPYLGDDVYAKLGNVYYKSRDRAKAIEMWERALEIDPGNEVVRTNLEFVRGSADGAA